MIDKISPQISFGKLKFKRDGINSKDSNSSKEVLAGYMSNDEKTKTIADGLEFLHYGSGKNKVELDVIHWSYNDYEMKLYYKNELAAHEHFDNSFNSDDMKKMFSKLGLDMLKNMAEINRKSSDNKNTSPIAILNRYV